MRKVLCCVCGAMLAFGCEQPQPQGPQEFTYQNGYAQTIPQAQGQQTSYQNGYAQRTIGPAPMSPNGAGTGVTYSPTTPTATTPQTDPATQIQSTPVALGVDPAPTATATPTTTTPTATPTKTMATPNGAAFICQSDAQCLLGRCNLQYQRCAYPCKNSEIDCKAGNVCTASGVCMPRGASGVRVAPANGSASVGVGM